MSIWFLAFFLLAVSSHSTNASCWNCVFYEGTECNYFKDSFYSWITCFIQGRCVFLHLIFSSLIFSPLTFYAQWLSIPTSTRKGELVQHNWLLFVCTALPVPGRTLAISIRCFRLCGNRGMVCPYFSLSQFPAKLGIILLKWDFTLPRLHLLKAQRQASPLFLPECVAQERGCGRGLNRHSS